MEPTALGTDFRGFAVSAATNPEFSDPAMAKMQVGMTERNPLKPLVKAMLFQYLKPIASPVGAPPAEMTASVSAYTPTQTVNGRHTLIEEMITTEIQPNLIDEAITSISPKILTAPILTVMITTQKMDIQAATGTAVVQNLKIVFTACQSVSPMSSGHRTLMSTIPAARSQS